MSNQWVRNQMKENWQKIKLQACELLYNEELESWKQAICYVGYIELSIHPDQLEYILQVERSTIFRNAKKAQKIIESNELSKLDVKITLAVTANTANVKNTKQDPPGPKPVENTTADVGCSNNVKDTIQISPTGEIEENTINLVPGAASEEKIHYDFILEIDRRKALEVLRDG